MMTHQDPIRVLLVDDEDIVCYGLKAIAQGTPEIEIVGEAGTGKAAIAQSQALQPDVILMDINMPEMDGVTATQEICRIQPHTKILILTTHDEAQYLVEAMQQGAVGYLLKNTPPEDFIQSIQRAHKGYLQLGPGLGQKLCQQLKAPVQPQLDTPKGITPREQDVLKLIATGASNREISKTLHITEKTVKNHVSSILSRVGVRDRTQLAIWANTADKDTSHLALA
ncbi:response regulator transcription factor [Acaryochloris sp. IP29b_bin.148]|uniref:response regulator n=1 Tax=Acaryochloris sp. IP29b_bin.148 TaxID=2969218 RepID=UPI002628C094|nr:response regulator transcription factor [Acaryochloris sp. IP29b_bin.148]